MMDCISIWQKDKDTTSEALPDEYKDKLRQELGREGNQARYGSGTTEFNDSGENSDIQRDQNPAKSDSVCQIEGVSEGFDKMNRG